MPNHGWYGVIDVDILVNGILDLRATLQEGCRDWEVEEINTILSKAGVLGVLETGDEDT